MESVVAVKIGQLIISGLALSIGFWMGKKLTNRIDYFIYTHSDEFKKFLEQRQEMIIK